jgi:hypothetical protein
LPFEISQDRKPLEISEGGKIILGSLMLMRRAISQFELLEKNSRVLVAASSDVDSLAKNSYTPH